MAESRNWKQVGGKWTRSLGERGLRVRLFQKRKGGSFYREVWRVGSGRDQACLWTLEKQEADRLGRQLYAALLSGTSSRLTGGPLTLGELWTRYSTQCPAYLDNKAHTKADAATRAKILMGHFGNGFNIQDLDSRHQAEYVKARRAGGIAFDEGKSSGSVRARSVEADLVLLHAMLNWAATVRLPGGGRLLDHNPLAGVRRPREENPSRPVATWERFEATRKAVQQLKTAAKSENERTRWLRIELALVLVEATGRRLGSIRQLRWEDFDFGGHRVRWRAEADKKGKEWLIPYPEHLFDEVRAIQRALGAVGGFVFPSEKNPLAPMDRHLFDKWLAHAEKLAGQPKLVGGLWHPYRRKWATERKERPLKDVAAAGGWTDTDTLLRCYQQADSETLLRVTSEERKLRDKAIEG
jgi:integrase